MPSVAKRALKFSVAAIDRVWAPPRGVVVLIYHRVGGRSTLDVDLPVDEFTAQIESLATSRRVISLDDAVTQLREDSPAEHDPIVVTFDDGTADFADVAVPILVRHGIPATLYLATDFVDRGRDFPNQGKPLSWAALADVHRTGLITVGSHTHTHALLDRLSPSDIDAELDRADDLIEEHLDVRPSHFAYPKAIAGSSPADAAVRSRYRSAALAGTHANRYGATDVHRLARSPIQRSDGMRYFEAKRDGGMRCEDALRVLANRWRYRDATV